jgi:hypothetical protein
LAPALFSDLGGTLAFGEGALRSLFCFFVTASSVLRCCCRMGFQGP